MIGNVSLQESLDNITLFSIITIMSFFLSVPVAVIVEGIKFTPTYIQSAVSFNSGNNVASWYFYYCL